MQKEIVAVILAAGLGKRMASSKAKVLHEIMGKPMIEYVLKTAMDACASIILVVGHQAEAVKGALDHYEGLTYALQAEQLGTGHAVACALPHLSPDQGHIMILCGDVPLVRSETLKAMANSHIRHGRDITLLATEIDNPYGYGRVIMDENDDLIAVVEEADASETQRRICLINTGIYCVERRFLSTAIQKIGSDNAQGEFYLTDIIAIGHGENRRIGVFSEKDASQFTGVNSRSDLQKIEAVLRGA